MCWGGGDCREMMAENFPEWIKDMIFGFRKIKISKQEKYKASTHKHILAKLYNTKNRFLKYIKRKSRLSSMEQK